MRDHIAYLKYILRHKWHVYKACRSLKVPLWTAIMHDWTKFLPSEWTPYVKNFYHTDGSKRGGKVTTVDQRLSFNDAWNSHQKRNKHHWQYWVLTNDNGARVVLPMPIKYIIEMVADWKGAGMAINGRDDVAEWYKKNGRNMYLHGSTRQAVECLVLGSGKQSHTRKHSQCRNITV